MPEYIYQLHDKTNDIIGYVGRTKTPSNRLAQHLMDAKQHLHSWRSSKVMSSKVTWLAYVLEKDYHLCMEFLEILQDCSSDKGFERETYWISTLSNQGHPLTNAHSANFYQAENEICPYNEPVDYSSRIPNFEIEI